MTETLDDLKIEKERLAYRILGLNLFFLNPFSEFDLSDLERSIAKLAIQGLTNKEIGKELDLSPSTIGTKIHRMSKRIGVSKSGLIKHFYKSLENLLQDPTGGTKK